MFSVIYNAKTWSSLYDNHHAGDDIKARLIPARLQYAIGDFCNRSHRHDNLKSVIAHPCPNNGDIAKMALMQGYGS